MKGETMSATVLVVEDEPGIQELMVYVLRLAGYRPVRADSAEQALELMRDENPDLVLLDWVLPGQSGIEFARRLRAVHRTASVPIIMVSARAHEDDRVMGLDTGVEGYLTKPFSPRELKALVKEVLHRAGGFAGSDTGVTSEKAKPSFVGLFGAPGTVGYIPN